MKKVLVDNKAVNVDETKTVFATKGALTAPTPNWAKNVFKGTVIVTSVIMFWVLATKVIPPNIKDEVILILKSTDLLVLGVSRLFGVEVKND